MSKYRLRLRTLILYNKRFTVKLFFLNCSKTFEVPLTIRDDRSGSALEIVIGARSLHTIVYPSKSVNVAPSESTTLPSVPTEATTEEDDNTISTTENGASANTSPFILSISILAIVNIFLAHWL